LYHKKAKEKTAGATFFEREKKQGRKEELFTQWGRKHPNGEELGSLHKEGEKIKQDF
jgi:hypothetical protein